METDASNAGRALRAFVRPREGRCAYCGKPFVGSPVRRYCSVACRNRAYRDRRDRKEGGQKQ